MDAHPATVAVLGINNKRPPPPPPPKKQSLRAKFCVQNCISKATAPGECTELDGPSDSDKESLHGIKRRDSIEIPSKDSPVDSQNPAGEDDKTPELTGAGREVMEDGKLCVIDEAHWAQSLQPFNSRQFALVTSNRDGKDQVSIKSPFLLSLFEKTIEKTGIMGTTMESNAVSIVEPYVPLYWCYSHIIQSGSEADDPNQQDVKDLQSLRYWYEKWVLPNHIQLRDTINSGFITFDNLGSLFRPGEMVFSQDIFEQSELSIVVDAYLDSFPMPPEPPDAPPGSSRITPFIIQTWCQGWEPSRRMFVKRSAFKYIAHFAGSRRIIDLALYPVRFFCGGDQTKIETLQRNLEQRGQRWKQLVGPSAKHLYHEGPATELRMQVDVMREERGFSTMDGLRRTTNKHLVERVVVDPSKYTPGLADPGRRQPGMPSIRPVIGTKAIDVNHGVPEEQPPSEAFSALQARLCPSTLQCCVPRTVTWYSVTVDNLKPITYKKDAMDALVIPHDTKEMLLGLFEEHERTKSQGAITDFIANKGESLIIVLHGPPGVGKTLTAETMAEYIEKPLFSISLGQLSDEENIDRRLGTIFDYSVSMGGVLLLDEADVVLEARSYENLKRNALVSVFLRMLEYYRGILFLTSNRMRSIDMAFQSRISIGVSFSKMTPDTRKQIWLNFINRFDDSNRAARDDLIQRVEDMKEWPLNGRQIRNILRLAQSLSFAQEKRSGALRFKHVERIATETLNFQEIFQEEQGKPRSQLTVINNRKFHEKRAVQPHRLPGSSEAPDHDYGEQT